MFLALFRTDLYYMSYDGQVYAWSFGNKDEFDTAIATNCLGYESEIGRLLLVDVLLSGRLLALLGSR